MYNTQWDSIIYIMKCQALSTLACQSDRPAWHIVCQSEKFTLELPETYCPAAGTGPTKANRSRWILNWNPAETTAVSLSQMSEWSIKRFFCQLMRNWSRDTLWRICEKLTHCPMTVWHYLSRCWGESIYVCVCTLIAMVTANLPPTQYLFQISAVHWQVLHTIKPSQFVN